MRKADRGWAAVCLALSLASCGGTGGGSGNAAGGGSGSSKVDASPAGGKTSGQQRTCDCETYPFPAGCDTQCGITDAEVASVSKDSVTVKITPSGSANAELKTIPLSELNRPEQAALQPGAKVQLTYRKSTAQPLTIQPGTIRSLSLRKQLAPK